jgi:hypothetical protein
MTPCTCRTRYMTTAAKANICVYAPPPPLHLLLNVHVSLRPSHYRLLKKSIHNVHSDPPRSEIVTAVTMKNAVFWDIKPQFVLQRRHVTFPLHSPAS